MAYSPEIGTDILADFWRQILDCMPTALASILPDFSHVFLYF